MIYSRPRPNDTLETFFIMMSAVHNNHSRVRHNPYIKFIQILTAHHGSKMNVWSVNKMPIKRNGYEWMFDKKPELFFIAKAKQTTLCKTLPQLGVNAFLCIVISQELPSKAQLFIWNSEENCVILKYFLFQMYNLI